MKPHWTVSVFSSCLWTAQGLSGPPNTTFCAVSHSWQFLAHILSLNARLVPVVVGFSWAFWGLCKQFIQVILKLMGTFSAWWDMKEAKWRNLTGQKIRLYINSGTALEVTIWISLEQEVKASLSDTITFVISASQAASGFSCNSSPVLATICSVKKTQINKDSGCQWSESYWKKRHPARWQQWHQSSLPAHTDFIDSSFPGTLKHDCKLKQIMYNLRKPHGENNACSYLKS